MRGPDCRNPRDKAFIKAKFQNNLAHVPELNRVQRLHPYQWVPREVPGDNHDEEDNDPYSRPRKTHYMFFILYYGAGYVNMLQLLMVAVYTI
jgi:hypothetical protein